MSRSIRPPNGNSSLIVGSDMIQEQRFNNMQLETDLGSPHNSSRCLQQVLPQRTRLAWLSHRACPDPSFVPQAPTSAADPKVRTWSDAYAGTKMPVPHTGIAKAPEAARQFMRTRITFFAAVPAHCAISRPRLNRTVRRHQPQRKARRDRQRRRARHGEAARTKRTRLYRADSTYARPQPPHSFSRPRRRRTV